MSVKLEPAVLAEVLWAFDLQPGIFRGDHGERYGVCPDCDKPNRLVGDRFRCDGPCENTMAAAALVSHAATFYAPARPNAPPKPGSRRARPRAPQQPGNRWLGEHRRTAERRRRHQQRGRIT